MLGVVLLYVGIVLINNGIARITNIDSKSAAVMNVFVGLLSIIINIITIVHGDFILIDDVGDFYSAATGLLFGFTYLFVAVNSIFNLDNRLYGWYSLFVAINTIPAAWIDFYINGDWKMAIIWILWGILWLTGFIENVLKKELKFVPYLAIFEGIFTAWIPGFLILTNLW
ncbi:MULTISPECIES: AmiS/UreI family transporter [Romboutsia]|jgi:acid-activated urea channel|uniref:AmiS/UreI transporter n=1 Tax=Romboutsia ilealis TaxID=1115758 RepID=A0A1V1I3J2_9FIRM|nr:MULTISPECIES: AmiS/UreI family transporter [Romboutsia]MCI9062815.1 acid-activated urea channel [Romboutsia sp.]MCI9259712.1 acid-activated urea channel [Romboutsia sp.]CED93994.1 AmiS/UreI transporter [Romboutsia ilealis]